MAEIKYLDIKGLKTLYGVVDGKVDKAIADEVAARNAAITTAIEGLDVTDTAVDGQFVTAVSETNGKVEITRGTVAAKNVTAEAVTAADAVTVKEGTVASQIVSLAKSLKTVEGNAAKYEVEKVTTNLPSNVEARYQVVSYVGTKTDDNKTKVGEFIDIPKDGQLQNVEVTNNTSGEPTVIKFTYVLDGGEIREVSIDLGKAIFESEMGDGIMVADSKIAIKLAEGNETFLTVDANGLKLTGVQDAINTAKAAATTKVKKDTAATHITVTEGTAEDGSVTYTIGETNIASADALTNEVNRATAAENKIEASVGLATDGSFTVPADKNYINGATTVMSAVEKLDAQVKVNADAISGAINESAQTITLGGKTLQFIAFTEKEIQDAAKPVAG